MKHTVIAALLAGSAMMSGAAMAEGDAAAGEIVYRQCLMCHTTGEGQPNRIGPNLYGLFGSTAGTKEGFIYSPPMMNSGIVWDEETLAGYLASPATYIPGNRMPATGVAAEPDLSNLIAYLKEATAPAE